MKIEDIDGWIDMKYIMEYMEDIMKNIYPFNVNEKINYAP